MMSLLPALFALPVIVADDVAACSGVACGQVGAINFHLGQWSATIFKDVALSVLTTLFSFRNLWFVVTFASFIPMRTLVAL